MNEDYWKAIQDLRELVARIPARFATTPAIEDLATRAILQEELIAGGAAPAILQKYENGTWKTWREKPVQAVDMGFIVDRIPADQIVFVYPRWGVWWVIQGRCIPT